MPKVNTNDPRPPYVQIADDIRQRVNSGDLQPGDRLAPNRELATEYGVAPMTVHQAIRTLRDENVLVSSQGRGVFVKLAQAVTPDRGESQPEDLRKQVEALQIRLDQMERSVADRAPARDVDVLQNEVAELRKQLGKLTSQMIDLYAKLGHPYPRDTTAGDSAKGRRGAG